MVEQHGLADGGLLSRWLLFMIARGAKTVVATSIQQCSSIFGKVLVKYLARVLKYVTRKYDNSSHPSKNNDSKLRGLGGWVGCGG